VAAVAFCKTEFDINSEYCAKTTAKHGADETEGMHALLF